MGGQGDFGGNRFCGTGCRPRCGCGEKVLVPESPGDEKLRRGSTGRDDCGVGSVAVEAYAVPDRTCETFQENWFLTLFQVQQDWNYQRKTCTLCTSRPVIIYSTIKGKLFDDSEVLRFPTLSVRLVHC